METFLKGKKTYIGIATLLVAALGFSEYISSQEVSAIIDSVLTVIGTIVAIYGRYNVTK
jgi:hypothetical protein